MRILADTIRYLGDLEDRVDFSLDAFRFARVEGASHWEVVEAKKSPVPETVDYRAGKRRRSCDSPEEFTADSSFVS